MGARNFLKGIALVLAGGLGLAHAENAPPWTNALAKEAMTNGFEAKLPPHAAMVLGLAKKGESIAVRQLVSRAPSDRKSTRLNSSHITISYAVFCLKKKKKNKT